MNEEDSEQMALYLEEIGYSKATSILEAQVVLLNTCSVRKKPEDKAFSMLGESSPCAGSGQRLIIGVCGCMAQARADEIRRRAPHVDFVLGTGNLAQLPGLVEDAAQGRSFQKRLDLPKRKGGIVERRAPTPSGTSAEAQSVCPDPVRMRQVLHLLHRPHHARTGAVPPDGRHPRGGIDLGGGRNAGGHAAGADGEFLRQEPA